jgi:16S rRNA processing protein RimM
MSSRILIGKIVAAHGIKGLVKIFPLCEDMDLLNGTLFTSEDGTESLKIKTKNVLGKFILAEVEGITDRNAAETIKCSLFVSRETLPEIDEEDGFYIEDLIGLSVYNKSELIGEVLTIANFGASDLIEIKPVSGKTFYIPYTDDYVIEIDLDQSRINVQDIDDFRET